MGLNYLSVKDYAIVDELELEFQDGMTVFTGETGAGKSILIDALGLALGVRAQASVVRKGAEKAIISASFDVDNIPGINTLLDNQGIDIEGECLLRRQISNDGRSRCFINGVAVSGQTLKTLSEYLIDIHGQHAHQSLLRHGVQQEMLDEFASHGELLSATENACKDYISISTKLEALSGDPAERENQKDLLCYQIDELKKASVTDEDIDETLAEHKRQANLTRITQACQTVEALFNSGEGVGLSGLSRSISSLQDVSDFDPKISSLLDIFNEARVLLDEAESQFQDLTDSLDFDQNKFDQLERRLGKLNDLARKHQVQIETLPETLAALQKQLKELESSEQQFQILQNEQQKALQRYQNSASKLSSSRRSQAEKFSELVTAEMQLLGMAGGRFEAVVSDKKNELQPSGAGNDQVRFLVSANPGQDLQALNKVASGGELSRISLAIQVIAARGKGVPTLVFDEVDVGIGGGIAEIVGKKMRELGKKRQVLCVTHLPQVASLGHHHLSVQKKNDSENTWTRIHDLKPQQRVEEIARMLGGLTITDQTRAHAAEMLNLV